MNRDSEIITKMAGMVYPFIILFGFYVILNGHLTPGGGFQGGAVLASVFISRYLAYPVKDIKIKTLQIFEKIFFMAIIAMPVFFVFTEMNKQAGGFNLFYLIAMNLLIGLKVCCGLTIIFLDLYFMKVVYDGIN